MLYFFFLSVLQRDPKNQEGIMIMESVNAIIDEQNDNKKAPKRKSKKKVVFILCYIYTATLVSCGYIYQSSVLGLAFHTS